MKIQFICFDFCVTTQHQTVVFISHLVYRGFVAAIGGKNTREAVVDDTVAKSS